VLLAGQGLGHALGLRARRVNHFHNGDLDCQLLRIDVEPRWFRVVRGDVADREGRADAPAAPVPAPGPVAPAPLTPGARMFANRIARNLRELGAWARAAGVDCFRVYDADMPEYAVAVDLYHGDRRWVVVQEYAAPPSVDPARAAARLAEVMSALPGALSVPSGDIFLKRRERQRGDAQYGRLQRRDEYHVVREGAARIAVNFTDYLDTGLFLDHRVTRARVAELARGRHFLNLYAYTGVATVQAALAGALTTTSVDLSGRYLDWIERNLHLNGLGGPAHRLVEADCTEWLQQAAAERRRWGVIFLDPPTFSNSKRMQGTLDVQRDHVDLIQAAMRLLEPDGVLLFSNNFRRFRIDREALAGLEVEDITAATLPEDFRRNPRIHRCWEIRWPKGAARELGRSGDRPRTRRRPPLG
jgi:23S rRNA (guanine2445-N2)-methyltransferase / 23S rRNA (guanine2069-N7)-methyltransferase